MNSHGSSLHAATIQFRSRYFVIDSANFTQGSVLEATCLSFSDNSAYFVDEVPRVSEFLM
jgi:hypothetical protein